MEKSDDTAMEIVDVEAGSMTFDNENSEWSLLPEPTPPRSPTSAVSDKDFSTPKKTPHTSLAKPTVGMSFENIDAVEQFYKSYAHDLGFSVRVGQQRLENDIVYWKRFMCSRQGYRKKKDNVHPTNGKKSHNIFETRCGCEAYIYVKLSSDNKYTIESMIEEHNHGFVSPDKRHLIRSNCSVSERAKNTLYNCHKASMGTSQAYRLLHVSEGGFDNIGCTLRDLQNYYRDLRKNITDGDAQMFVAQLERKKNANPAFFYDFVVDEKGRLVHVFWADATSRKNYSHFCDVVSFDSTYSTNEYNMIFAPFTGVNHHLQSIFIGGAFLANEKIESYEWLFKTFLVAMGGVAPSLIITDEAASIRAAIAKIFPDTVHRLCMFHIMDKFPEKVGANSAAINDEESDFWPRLNPCVWGSETGEEFESQWNSLMSDYGLHGNEWIQNRYQIRKRWIPAYYMDVPLAGILRTTSRSESANSFFSHFIHRKLSLVEFWLRFETALEWQRQEELKADNKSIHSSPFLKTTWKMEKQGSMLYTHEVFLSFQKEVVAARDYCWVQNIAHFEEMKIVTISDGRNRDREVHCNTSMMATCSCKLFQLKGVPCRHIILVLRGEKQVELPIVYFMKRWEKRSKSHSVYDEYGNILDDKIIESNNQEMRKKIVNVRNKFEDLISKSINSDAGMDFLLSAISNLEAPLNELLPPTERSKQDEYEAFIGCHIPDEVTVYPPNDIRSKGRSKRIKKSKETGGSKKKQGRTPRMCRICKQMVLHDARNCPAK